LIGSPTTEIDKLTKCGKDTVILMRSGIFRASATAVSNENAVGIVAGFECWKLPWQSSLPDQTRTD
jgi:hypothetical protein